jgi:succinoglycan biosynthesis protein ExoA
VKGSVLVVVPALNEGRTIRKVIESLLLDPPSGGPLSIVVADGGSSDDTVAEVQRLAAENPMVHLMHNPRRIQSAAVNLAARTLGNEAEVLIRCDAHAVYPAGYCRRLLDTLERTGADAVVVPMDSVGEGCLQRAVAWVSDTPVGSGGSAHRGGRRSGWVDHGHHAAFRMDTFLRAGGYDETYTHNEDAEFDCRQAAMGARVYLDADIRIEYKPRATLAALWHQYFSYGHGRARTARRHPASLRVRQLAVPAHLGVCVIAVAAAPWLPVLLLWPALYFMALGATSLTLSIRHRAVCGLLAGPAAAVMHAAWACGFVTSIIRLREKRWHPRHARPMASEVLQTRAAASHDG